jgi:hypothetical protein
MLKTQMMHFSNIQLATNNWFLNKFQGHPLTSPFFQFCVMLHCCYGVLLEANVVTLIFAHMQYLKE